MDFLEFFAGVANLTYACRQKMYKCAKFDILYQLKEQEFNTNYMDLSSASGFLCLGPEPQLLFS